MPLSPRDVVHLCHDGFERRSIGGIAVIQIERAKVVTPVAKLTQHSHGALKFHACLGANNRPDLLKQRGVFVAFVTGKIIARNELHRGKRSVTAQDSTAIQLR